jgi:hypothetical protein
MRHGDDRRDSAASTPVAFERHASRIHNGHKVVQDTIGNVLVEDSLVAKFLKVQLQALQFDTFQVRDVSKDERAEIWLASFGAHRCKLGAFDFDMVVAVGERVIEAFELILKRRAGHSFFSKFG